MKHTFLLISILFTIQSEAQNQSNKHFWHSDTIQAHAQTIWNIWTDVPKWKEWDSGLSDAYIEGPLKLDQKGYIIDLKGRKSKFKITAYEEGVSYTFRTKLPFGALYVKRYLEPLDEQKVKFTHEVQFKGLTKGIFGRSLGKKFRTMLPEVLSKIKSIAER